MNCNACLPSVDKNGQVVSLHLVIISSPDDEIRGESKLKAFTDDSFYVVQGILSFFRMIENIVRIGDIADYRNFLLFSITFSKTCSVRALRLWKSYGNLFFFKASLSSFYTGNCSPSVQYHLKKFGKTEKKKGCL